MLNVHRHKFRFSIVDGSHTHARNFFDGLFTKLLRIEIESVVGNPQASALQVFPRLLFGPIAGHTFWNRAEATRARGHLNLKRCVSQIRNVGSINHDFVPVVNAPPRIVMSYVFKYKFA